VGAASGTATANPAVGVAIGIGVKAGVDESINYLLRYWSHEEQSQIASTVGGMAIGQRRTWSVQHELPYDNKQGHVTVVRVLNTPLTSCKEALFSVEDSKEPATNTAHFLTMVCQGNAGWSWAVSEPAIGRWGALQ
jgi:hypothetical protein